MPKLKLLTLISSLSFGGLVGMAAAALLYKGHPQFFQSFGFIAPYWFVAYGGALGGAVHSAIAYVFLGVFSPLFRFAADYERLLEAYLWYIVGVVDAEKLKKLVEHTIDKRFGISTKEDKAEEKMNGSINKLAAKILLKLGAKEGEEE